MTDVDYKQTIQKDLGILGSPNVYAHYFHPRQNSFPDLVYLHTQMVNTNLSDDDDV